MISILKKDEPLTRTPGAHGTATQHSSVSEPATDIPKLPLLTDHREVTTEHDDEDEGWEEREKNDAPQHPVNAPLFLNEIGNEYERSEEHDTRQPVHNASEREHSCHHHTPCVDDAIDVCHHPSTFLTTIKRRECNSATNRHGSPPFLWFLNVPSSRMTRLLSQRKFGIFTARGQAQVSLWDRKKK